MVTKCTNIAHCIYDQTGCYSRYTDGRKGVLEEAGGKLLIVNITQAAPNELKLGEVG